MAALGHVFLHLALCKAVAHAEPQTTVAIHVQMKYATGYSELDKVYRVVRGDDPQAVVEFDVASGTYRLQVDVPKYGCAATDYLTIFSGLNRNVAETLADRPEPQPVPGVLMGGTAPLSFLYVKPTVAFFDKSLACNGPVENPLPAHVAVEYDQGSYYMSLYPDAAFEAHAPVVVALRLKTPTGTAHYIRIPLAVPAAPRRWPDQLHMDVTSDMLDAIATDKTETLLCPKVWETSVH